MKTRQKRVKKAIEYLQNYINTYDRQIGYLDYMDETIIDDVLYGLGVALGGKKHEMAPGYRKFKAILRKHLDN